MGLYDPFEYLKYKLWLKEGLRIKVPISLSTTKIKDRPKICMRKWHATFR